ncbi:hemicentin-2-like [Haliotis rufescens]|uniref:hemicentin-2-like n=1 Tax=Haliotis rufescens TaxID=6454 RepID=UPI00201F7225|nr:hemicentin-2-like [Haliotis rufescens]
MGWLIVLLSLFLLIGPGDPDLIRLVPGTFAGRLEIYHGGAWGTVCDDGFDLNDAKVVCRGFGLNALSVKASAHYGQGTGSIMMDDVACTGSEMSLDRCSHPGWETHNCGHGEDVGVECVSVPGQPFMYGPARTRLVSPSAGGRLEVFVQSWGTVCSDRFDRNDAKTACRGLGLPTSHAYVVPTSFFGSGTGDIWVDDLECTGSEASIDSCARPTWGEHNCNHDKDVGVVCASTFSEVVRFTTVSLSVNTIQVFAGTSQTVTCNVKTPPTSPLTYTWTVGGVINGTSSTFTRVLVNADNDKELQCSVRLGVNDLGRASVALTVVYAPVVSCQSEYFILYNASVQLSCEVDASPGYSSISWSSSTGRLLSSGASASYILEHVTESQTLTCTADNTMRDSNGVTKTGNSSCHMAIKVLKPPPTTQSGSVAVFEGDYGADLSLPSAASPPPSSFKWRKVGSPWSTASTAPPRLHNISRADAGDYVIEVTNIIGSNESSTHVSGQGAQFVHVDVLYPPEVVCQEDVSVLLKSSFDLRCKACASPLPDDVTWARLSIPASTIPPPPTDTYPPLFGSGEKEIIDIGNAEEEDDGSGSDLDGRASRLRTRLDGITESTCEMRYGLNTMNGKIGTYHIPRSSTNDAGVYQCTAVNTMLDHTGKKENGTGSCLTSVNVLYPPSPLNSGTKDVFEGGSVILSLPQRSNPRPHVYTWKREGNELEVSSNTPPVISNIRTSDAGMYIVRLTNLMNLTYGGLIEGHGNQLVHINVLYSPVVSCRKEYVVVQNSSVSLMCSVDAFPGPGAIRWLQQASNKIVMTGDKFTIDDVQMIDGGVYICTATNSMTDTNGQMREGTGSCTVRVKVVSRVTTGNPGPAPESYHSQPPHFLIFIVGGVLVVAIIILVLLVIRLRRKLKGSIRNDEKVEENTDIPLSELPGVSTHIDKQM